jgi:hypothetical protein
MLKIFIISCFLPFPYSLFPTPYSLPPILKAPLQSMKRGFYFLAMARAIPVGEYRTSLNGNISRSAT